MYTVSLGNGIYTAVIVFITEVFTSMVTPGRVMV